MKKIKLLYAVLLFVSCNVCKYETVYAQVTVALSSASQTASPNAVVSIGSGTYTAGFTYIFFIATKASGVNPTDNPTVSSGGLTLVKRGSFAGSFNDRIIVYTADVSSGTTTGITFTYAETQTSAIYAVYTANSTGLQFDFAGATNATTNPSVTLTSRLNFSAIAMFTNNANPFGGTAESGWTEDFDSGNAVPIGRYGTSRSNTSDNSISVTASSSNWTGAGLQIYSTTRQRIHIQ